MDVLISASALLLVLRHSCYVGRHVLFSTLVLLISATTLLLSTSVLLISATTLLISTSILLISATALLLSTSILLISATALLFSGSALFLCATAPQYCIVPSGTYCVASYSFLMFGLVVKQLYDKTLNKEKRVKNEYGKDMNVPTGTSVSVQ